MSALYPGYLTMPGIIDKVSVRHDCTCGVCRLYRRLEDEVSILLQRDDKDEAFAAFCRRRRN